MGPRVAAARAGGARAGLFPIDPDAETLEKQQYAREDRENAADPNRQAEAEGDVQAEQDQENGKEEMAKVIHGSRFKSVS